MLNLKSLCSILVVLCFILLQYASGKTHASRGSKTVSEGFLSIGEKSFDNGYLTFAVCHTDTPSLIHCDLVQRSYLNKEEIRENTRICNVTLKGDHEESDISVTIGVTALGRDKAILFWGEDFNYTSIVKVGTVDFKTCEMNVMKIPDPKREIFMELFYTNKLVAYNDDSFDIFINDPKRYGGKLGKLTIDGNGKGEASPSNIEAALIFYLSPIANRSSSKGFAYLKKYDTDFTLMLVKPDGKEKELARYTNSARPIVSAGNNFVRACSQADANNGVICTQYDEDGNVKFVTTVSSKDEITRPESAINLPGGGLLVMLAKPKPCDEPSTCKNDSKYGMMKIAADGKIVGTVSTKEFDSVSNKYKSTYVYKNVDSEYCAVIIGVDPSDDEHKPSYYQILHHCVTEDEFSTDVQ